MSAVKLIFLQILNEASTINKLEQNVVQNFPDTSKRQNAVGEVSVGTITYTPYPEQSTLKVEAQTRSNQHNYQTVCQFDNVQFTNDGSGVQATGTTGEQFTLQPIDLNASNVKVRCSCLDFHWRFSMWNAKDDSLYGEPPGLYQKKTDRPPVNPNQVPGVCKHLIRLIDRLGTSGLVK